MSLPSPYSYVGILSGYAISLVVWSWYTDCVDCTKVGFLNHSCFANLSSILPLGHSPEAVPHPALHPPHHGVGKQRHPGDHITNPSSFQVLFGMFVIAIACDQFEAIFSDETLVSCCETTVLLSLNALIKS